MAAGRSYEQIDEMTLFDLDILTTWWEKNPPMDLMLRLIAQWCGVYKPDTPTIMKASPMYLQALTAGIMSQFEGKTFKME